MALTLGASAAGAQSFGVTSLVTDDQSYLTSQGFGPAVTVDPSLINPWGMDHSSTGAWFIGVTGSEASSTPGVASYYTGKGLAAGASVSMPQGYTPPNGPTGVVYNPYGSAFTVGNGGPAAQFIVSNLDGSISGVAAGATSGVTLAEGPTPSPPPPGIMAPTHSVYTGVAIGADGANDYIYAANNRTGSVDVYNSSYSLVNLGTGAFTDPAAGMLAPFNVQNLNGDIWVTYAVPGPDSDEAGLGSGVVAEYSPDGKLILSIADPHMSSPWALAVAPSSFGAYAGDVLVGNFSHDENGQQDAFISAFKISTDASNIETATFQGTLNDAKGNPIQLPGLWQIEAGNDGAAGSSQNLYFTAGIGDEQHGLFGYISAAPEPSVWLLMIAGVGVAGLALRRRSPAQREVAA